MVRLRRLIGAMVPAVATTVLLRVGTIANGMARAPMVRRLRPRADFLHGDAASVPRGEAASTPRGEAASTPRGAAASTPRPAASRAAVFSRLGLTSRL